MEIKEKHFWYMIFILVLLVPTMVNLKVATSTPIIFGDEGYFASRGEWILENLEIPKYTTDVYSENNLFHNFDLELQEIVFLVSSFFALSGIKNVSIIFLILLTGLMIFLFAKRLYSYNIGIFFLIIYCCIITVMFFIFHLVPKHMFMVAFMLALGPVIFIVGTFISGKKSYELGILSFIFFFIMTYIIFYLGLIFVKGGEFVFVKMLDPISALLAGIMVFLLARKLYSGKIGVLSVFFFLILPCITTYAVFLYGDMLFTLFMVSSMYFLLRSVKENSNKYLFISGIMGGFAIFTKETGFLIFLIYLITFIFYRKNWLKKFIILLLLSSVIAIPWYGLHNFVLLGNPGIPVIEDFFPKDYLSPEIKIMNQTQLPQREEGTYASIMKYGILNYVQFSYGLGSFIFIIMGISYALYRRGKDDLLILIWSLILFIFIFYVGGGGKVESLSRWLLPVMPLFAIFAGLSTAKIYEFLREYGNGGKIFAVLSIFIIVIFGLFTANAKAASLEPIKRWSPAFIKGCDWIRRNTPEDSKIMSIWIHHGMYHCKRDMHWVNMPNKDFIVSVANDTSYELLKKEGINYIYFQKFSISFEKRAEGYPVEFVRYVENSDHFEKVYEYPDNCMYSGIADCVAVYKIK